MKEQWVGKMEMLDLLDAVLSDLETVEKEISTKIDEVVSLYEYNQQEALQTVENTIIDIQKATAELQQQSGKREWTNQGGEVILRPV